MASKYIANMAEIVASGYLQLFENLRDLGRRPIARTAMAEHLNLGVYCPAGQIL